MARNKKSDENGTNGTGTETLPPPAEQSEPHQNGNGNGDKRKPAYKVGPIPTGKGESVGACVWANDHTMPDGRTYTVHSIQLELSYYNENDRQWRQSKSIRPSQLSAVEYVLRQCADYCFRSRDPQDNVNF